VRGVERGERREESGKRREKREHATHLKEVFTP